MAWVSITEALINAALGDTSAWFRLISAEVITVIVTYI